jgi:hypothetical protein
MLRLSWHLTDTWTPSTGNQKMCDIKEKTPPDDPCSASRSSHCMTANSSLDRGVIDLAHIGDSDELQFSLMLWTCALFHLECKTVLLEKQQDMMSLRLMFGGRTDLCLVGQRGQVRQVKLEEMAVGSPVAHPWRAVSTEGGTTPATARRTASSHASCLGSLHPDSIAA